jgi:hypothetical protein
MVTNYLMEISTNNFAKVQQTQNYGLAVDVPYPFIWTNIIQTIYCQGTGTVYSSTQITGPWSQIKTNFHGPLQSWTNTTPPGGYYKGPGMTNLVTKFN